MSRIARSAAGPRRREKGYALVGVLILMMLGSLLLTPLLNFMGTGVTTGEMYKDKTEQLYAADAGIEDGYWQIRYDHLATTCPGYEKFNYSDNFSYALPSPGVNGIDPVNVTIRNVWIPMDPMDPMNLIPPSDPSDALRIITGAGTPTGEPKVLLTTAFNADNTCEIKISYYPGAGDSLEISTVGIWLSGEFSFDIDNVTSNLDSYIGSAPSVIDHKGGKAIICQLPSYPFKGDAGPPLKVPFPGPDGTGTLDPSGTPPLESKITFSFTAPAGSAPTTVAWIDTNTDLTQGGGQFIGYAWSADTLVYHVKSVAGETEVESYVAKNELRQLQTAINGDYRAIGNSLMIDTQPLPAYTRDSLLADSSATVSDIPNDATVKAAYLYWSGYLYSTTTSDMFSDDCSDFGTPPVDWTRTGIPAGNQTRVPTGDGDINGTWTPWTPSTKWDDVDETSASPPNDADYMTGTTDSGGHQLFTFAAFSAPAGADITALTIYVRARDVSNGNNNIRARIKVDGSYYNFASTNNPTTSFQTYSYQFNTNPATGLAWTADEINGVASAVELQQFGVYSSDLNPDIRVSMVYAQVDWASSIRWSISSGRFQGQGATSASVPERTLTMAGSLDLSSCAGETVHMSWDQSESGTLGFADTLYYAYSKDGGTSWSANIAAFNDDNPPAFSTTIPDEYLTSGFKLRFYFNFSDSGKYVYLNDLRIFQEVLPSDDEVYFEIDNQQCYFDAGVPTQGSGTLTADSVQVLANYSEGGAPPDPPDGYFYSCKKDVTELVRAFSAKAPDPAINHPGNGTYTVGGVDAYIANQFSYAGWSLVIIYTSAETQGHMLFLYDTMRISVDDANTDFDGDGQPGGGISGFLVPQPVSGEVNAAKITAFVGEGDSWYSGDSLRFNGTKLDDGTAGGTDNVWNSSSAGMSAQGVDVDSFTVTWASGLLQPGDTSAQIDLWSQEDTWQFLYMILSFRTVPDVSGSLSYLITQ